MSLICCGICGVPWVRHLTACRTPIATVTAVGTCLQTDHDAAIKAALDQQREEIAQMVESECWILVELPSPRFTRKVAAAIRAGMMSPNADITGR